MAGWTFTNADGVTLNLDDGADYAVQTYGGVGLGDLDIAIEGRPDRAGGLLRTARIPARSIRLSIAAFGTSHTDLLDNARALIAHVAGSRGRREPRVGTLTYTTPGGASRALRCVGVAGFGQAARDQHSALRMNIPAQFAAAHPNWYNPTEQSAQGTTGAAGSIIYGTSVYPLNYGPNASSTLVTATVAGSAETESMLWEVPGPVTGPVLFSLDLAREVRFPNLTVPDGLTLRVRMGWRPDGIEALTALMDDGAGSETDVIGYMRSGSRRMHLLPGANVLSAGQTSEAATVHTIKWFDEYLST